MRARRLTAAKEAGASIEIDGKKVALGIPTPAAAAVGQEHANIPLRRPGTADEAGAAMLLFVSACPPAHLC